LKTLALRNPVNYLTRNNGYDRFFEDFLHQSFSLKSWNPSVDIIEKEDAYYLSADLPGLSREDLDIKVEQDILSLSSVKKEDKEEKMEGYLLKERSSSAFRRSFKLSSDVDRTLISASFDKGVLSVKMTKLPEAKAQTIEIK